MATQKKQIRTKRIEILNEIALEKYSLLFNQIPEISIRTEIILQALDGYIDNILTYQAIIELLKEIEE